VSRLEAGPVFVVELLDEGRWCPTGFLTQDENVGWELIEGQPGDLYRLVRVDSWRGRVVAVSDMEGLVEPV